MSGSQYRSSIVDGLPARVSGPWAQEKLAYLSKYMSIFNVGMKNKWRRVYIDLLAGPGRCIEDDSGTEFDGSPLVAINRDVPFSDVLLVEGDPELANALRQRVGVAATVLTADCNDSSVIENLRGRLGYGTLGLAFVDNLGLDVTLATLRSLSSDRKLDLCITFQIGDLKRNLGSALAGTDADRWTAFFGEGWRTIAEDAERRNVSAGVTATRLLDFYGRQLNEIGYPYVAHSRRIMKNSRNVGLYRLLLAGKHERAIQFFHEISAIEPGGQRGLLWATRPIERRRATPPHHLASKDARRAVSGRMQHPLPDIGRGDRETTRPTPGGSRLGSHRRQSASGSE
jgi:three-Cys-motif partner protein